jgi:hypothetical protein
MELACIYLRQTVHTDTVSHVFATSLFSDMWKTCCRARLHMMLKPLFLESQSQAAAALLSTSCTASLGIAHQFHTAFFNILRSYKGTVPRKSVFDYDMI